MRVLALLTAILLPNLLETPSEARRLERLHTWKIQDMDGFFLTTTALKISLFEKIRKKKDGASTSKFSRSSMAWTSGDADTAEKMVASANRAHRRRHHPISARYLWITPRPSQHHNFCSRGGYYTRLSIPPSIGPKFTRCESDEERFLRLPGSMLKWKTRPTRRHLHGGRSLRTFIQMAPCGRNYTPIPPPTRFFVILHSRQIGLSHKRDTAASTADFRRYFGCSSLRSSNSRENQEPWEKHVEEQKG